MICRTYAVSHNCVNKCVLHCKGYTKSLKARGGGVKVDFPVFTYLIRAAGDEQEEKNRTEI